LYTEFNTGVPMKKPRKKVFDQKKEVRALARERVGAVKSSRVLVPKTERKKPKHKATLAGLGSDPEAGGE
jgi:hypothetical protein